MTTAAPTLAFSTNAFTRHRLVDAIHAIADAGFTAVEILADAPHAYLPAMTEVETAEIRQALTKRRLTISNINANCTFGYWRDAPPEAYFEPSLISPDDKHRRDRIGLIKKTIDLAAALGATTLSITSGRCNGWVSPAIAATRLASGLREVLDHAEGQGINVGVELEPGLYLESVAELRHWIGTLDHPRLGANLDIGHSVVNGERIDESVLTLAGRIWNMHVEDLPGRKHYHTIPGEGTFDWPQLRRVLRSVGYDRSVTVELYTQTEEPAEAARRSYAFLSRMFMA